MTSPEPAADAPLKAYRFHWHNGEPTTLKGTSAHDALNRAGHGRGVLRILDYFEPLDP